MLERFRSNLQLAVISVVAALSMLWISPFAVYRFANGQLLLGAIDSVIVLLIGWTLVRMWRGGSVQQAGLIMVVVSTASCILVSLMFGHQGLLSAYVTFTTNFMITERRYALLGNSTILLVLASLPTLFSEGFERVVFLATGSCVSMSAFLFAQQADGQRQRLEALASHDALTGVRNRLSMHADLALALAAHSRDKKPYGIAMLDLDRFKRVNDAFGHEAGDRVLLDFARIAEANCRKRDRLYRFGGEEFVLLLQDTPESGVRTALDKLRAAVAAELRTPDASAVTVSIGAAMLGNEINWPDWLARADSALYRAKGRGRNTVVVDGEPPDAAEAVDHERRGR